MVTGYAHPSYAASLAEFGEPRLLPRSGGWVLERTVTGTGHRDAMGCYPLFFCENWDSLGADLDAMATELLSLVLVAVPDGAAAQNGLAKAFPTGMRPFKTHFIAELGTDPLSSVSKHHRYYARRALAQVQVERCADPAAHLDEWAELYGELADRHGLRGVQAFSRRAFEIQLRVPGITMFLAKVGGRTVAAHLWYIQGDTAFSHLAAANHDGYELNAAYALHAFALESFSGRVSKVNFGGGAGLSEAESQGLSRFKRGWANASQTAYLCTRVFDRDAYAEACTLAGVSPNAEFFPAYRAAAPGGI